MHIIRCTLRHNEDCFFYLDTHSRIPESTHNASGITKPGHGGDNDENGGSSRARDTSGSSISVQHCMSAHSLHRLRIECAEPVVPGNASEACKTTGIARYFAGCVHGRPKEKGICGRRCIGGKWYMLYLTLLSLARTNPAMQSIPTPSDQFKSTTDV